MAHNWSMNLLSLVHEVLGETDYYFYMFSCENIQIFGGLNVQYTKFSCVTILFWHLLCLWGNEVQFIDD
jgi:hypothetical protein